MRCSFMLKKSLKITAFATALTASAIAPSFVLTAEAASVSIQDVVVEKSGKFYAIDINTYYALKSVNHAVLKEITLQHVYSSEGNIYSVTVYQNAQAAGGSMAGAFKVLTGKGQELDLVVGKIEFPSNNQPPVFVDGDEKGEVESFRIISIE